MILVSSECICTCVIIGLGEEIPCPSPPVDCKGIKWGGSSSSSSSSSNYGKRISRQSLAGEQGYKEFGLQSSSKIFQAVVVVVIIKVTAVIVVIRRCVNRN